MKITKNYKLEKTDETTSTFFDITPSSYNVRFWELTASLSWKLLLKNKLDCNAKESYCLKVYYWIQHSIFMPNSHVILKSTIAAIILKGREFKTFQVHAGCFINFFHAIVRNFKNLWFVKLMFLCVEDN